MLLGPEGVRCVDACGRAVNRRSLYRPIGKENTTYPFSGFEEGANKGTPLESRMAGNALKEPVEAIKDRCKLDLGHRNTVSHSSLLRSINSGLNLSPVMYSDVCLS